MDPVRYLSECDAEKIRVEDPKVGVRIVSERMVEFLEGKALPQFTIESGSVRGFLVPTSLASQARQKAKGRFLPPYGFVQY